MTDHGTLHRSWLEPLAGALARDGQAVLVVVAPTQGLRAARSRARRWSSRLTRCAGTIGGGHLEFEALRIARDALATQAPTGTWIVRFPLAARLGQCCGGVATLAFSTVDAACADVARRRASRAHEPARRSRS